MSANGFLGKIMKCFIVSILIVVGTLGVLEYFKKNIIEIITFTSTITILKLLLSCIYKPLIPPSKDKKRTVTAILPNYNEKLSNVKRGFFTLLNQDYEIDQFIFVDDGSDNDEAYQYVRKMSEQNPKIYAFRFDENKGKKAAQEFAFDHVTSEYVLLFDTDSLLDTDSLSKLMAGFEKRDTGAVVGTIRVSNKKSNLMVNMQKLLYASAFRFTRASQSVTGCVRVCSGAFSVYKYRIIKRNIHRFKGKIAGFDLSAGDDRLLTAIVLEDGYKTRYQSNAICYTEVPESLSTFLKQQVRWARSGYILAFFSMKMVFKNPFIPLWQWTEAYVWFTYILLSLWIVIQQILLFLSGFPSQSVGGISSYGFYLSLFYFFANYCMSNIYLFKKQMNLYLYGFYHMFIYTVLLIYIQLKALFTLKKETWDTR